MLELIFFQLGFWFFLRFVLTVTRMYERMFVTKKIQLLRSKICFLKIFQKFRKTESFRVVEIFFRIFFKSIKRMKWFEIFFLKKTRNTGETENNFSKYHERNRKIWFSSAIEFCKASKSV